MKTLRNSLPGRAGSPNRLRTPQGGGSLSRHGAGSRQAFTLIEMMVVVALIGILIGGVFRLIGAAGENAKRAETIDRMQRVENALSGFYSEYGTYPPVARHGSPDPLQETDEDRNDDEYKKLTTEEARLAYRSRRASRCQPMAFEFPTIKAMDNFINQRWGSDGIYSANQNPGAFDSTKTKWEEVKLFRFGVLSFLLPRLEVIGNFRTGGGEDDRPAEEFFDFQQWKQYNDSRKGSYDVQLTRESTACARWMPNLEGLVCGGKPLFGVETAERDAGYPQFSTGYSQGTGNRHILSRMTVRDGWDRELFYYSAAPYQSYRIWSSGKDGNTFPPWIPLDILKQKNATSLIWVNKWIKDDIARFDH